MLLANTVTILSCDWLTQYLTVIGAEHHDPARGLDGAPAHQRDARPQVPGKLLRVHEHHRGREPHHPVSVTTL